MIQFRGVKMRKEEINVIKNCFLFENISDEILKEVIEKGFQFVEFEKGEVIYDKNNFKHSIGLILKGCVEIYRSKLLLNKLCEGGIFGVAAVFSDSQQYSSRIIATKKCKIAFISENNLKVLFSEDANFAVNYIKFLSDRIAFLNRKIDGFSAPDAEVTVARFICQNAANNSKFQHEVGVKSYSETAQRLNIGRASLYRALDALEAEGLIQKDGKTLRIRNFELLQKKGK